MLQGEEFQKVAYEYSDAPDSNQGGSLGELSKMITRNFYNTTRQS